MQYNTNVINKSDIPPDDYYKTAVEPPLRKVIRELPLDKAIKFTCHSHADVKQLQIDAHAAAAFLRRGGQKLSLRTQILEKPLTAKRQIAHDEAKHTGLFRCICYLYVWKDPVEE